jgi:hypothetical protein
VTERVFLRFLCPLSQKSKIFASSPKGRAKATYGGNLPDKGQFEHSNKVTIRAVVQSNDTRQTISPEIVRGY